MRSTPTLAALCAVAALALTACGNDDDPGKDRKPSATAKTRSAAPGLADLPSAEILDKAVRATKDAPSLHVKLDGTVDGTRVRWDMSSDREGHCAGTVGMGDEGTVRLVKVGDTAYMKYDAAFWASQGADGAAAAEAIGDRWTRTAASGEGAEDLVQACDKDGLLSGFTTGPSVAKKGEVTTLDGKRVVTLTERDGEESATLYIAAEGEPYILKIDVTGGAEPGVMRFSDFGKPVEAVAPTGDVVDLDA